MEQRFLYYVFNNGSVQYFRLCDCVGVGLLDRSVETDKPVSPQIHGGPNIGNESLLMNVYTLLLVLTYNTVKR